MIFSKLDKIIIAFAICIIIIMARTIWFIDHKCKEPINNGKQIDNIESLYAKARQREQWYLSQLKQDSTGMAELKRKIQIQGIKIKSYEIKLHDIDKVVISNLDSFFVATYPDSLGPDADK